MAPYTFFLLRNVKKLIVNITISGGTTEFAYPVHPRMKQVFSLSTIKFQI
jgi:hypothetical protein